jgi:hypothetical protein
LRILKGTQQFWFDEKSNDNSQNTFENALKTFKKTQDKKFTERNKIK